MIRVALALIALPFACIAQTPVFIDRSDSLSHPQIYDGDWQHFVGGGLAVLDCNLDGLPDFYVAGGTNDAVLFVNKSAADDLSFEQSRGVAPLDHVTGAYPLDFDGDGLHDLMVLRVGQNKLLRGLGNCEFQDAGDGFGFQSADRWSTAFSAIWEDENDLPTLAIGNYVDRANPDGPFGACDDNQLYRPLGRSYPAPHALIPGHCALSMLFSDWSRSGQRDLRISNDRHYYVRDGNEQMWRTGEDRFLGPSDNWQPISIWGMGIASQDITGDTYPDVVLTSMGDQLMQIGGKQGFHAAPFDIGTYAHRPFIGDDGRPSTGWHAEFGDVNNDGFDDLFIAKGNVDQMPGLAMLDPNNLLMQQPDGTFVENAGAAGVASLHRSRGAALVDLNRDGLLDLVVVNRRAPMEVWLNQTVSAGNWISLNLRQHTANRNAIGAWIEIRDQNGNTRTSELTIGGGHVSGQLGATHFGLGAAPDTEVRVIWPNGKTSNWVTLLSNQFYTLTRDKNGFVQALSDD